ncbi:MAG: FAD-dependent oxidoreductase [Sphaerochaetaceae bacterium]|nr:FAD-dependent oxidoreductase [Sphaerochaetaceae bacterium]MDC7236186.1 FAD-dependent oxidoreductase [Sphaerochaetaceae bacterium]MDC7250938.1 FAD-dependent oxidoreductase [Sphaerochaetaceae bacterium]
MGRDTLIIGGGISGLVTAAYLSKNNLDVTLIEKCDKVGGLIGSFEKDGFLFDSGIRATENSGSLFPMLRDLKINLEFLENTVSIKVKDKIIKVKNEDSLKDYETMLSSIFTEDKNEIHTIIKLIKQISDFMEVLYGIDNPLFLDMKQDKDYLMKTVLPWMIKYKKTINKIVKLNEPVNEYLSKITTNKALIDVISQHFFKDTPTFFALSYFRLYNDYYYPKGGTKSLIEALENYIISNNGKIIKNTEIKEINIKDKTVKSNNKTFEYDKLIWAADLKTLYNIVNIEGATSLNLKEYNKKLNAIKTSHGNDSIYTLYLTTDIEKGYYKDKCSEHTFFTPSIEGLSSMEMDEKELLKTLENNPKDKIKILDSWLKDFSKKTTYEISIPVLRDTTLAPNGKSALIISMVFDYDLTLWLEKNNLYKQFKEKLNTYVIECLTETLLPNLKDKIIDSFSSSPLTIQKLLNNSEGAITGWSFTKEIPVESRMKKMGKAIITPFDDIIQTGHWVFSPSGMPTSIIIGKLAADRIVRKKK